MNVEVMNKEVKGEQKVKSLLLLDYEDYRDGIVEELSKHSNNKLRVAILAHRIFEDADHEVYDEFYVDGNFELCSDPYHDPSGNEGFSSREEQEMDGLIEFQLENAIERRLSHAIEFKELEV